MKFEFTLTSAFMKKDIIEINTLEELLKYLDHENIKNKRYQEIVLGVEKKDGLKRPIEPKYYIEIYDDYRE